MARSAQVLIKMKKRIGECKCDIAAARLRLSCRAAKRLGEQSFIALRAREQGTGNREQHTVKGFGGFITVKSRVGVVLYRNFNNY